MTDLMLVTANGEYGRGTTMILQEDGLATGFNSTHIPNSNEAIIHRYRTIWGVFTISEPAFDCALAEGFHGSMDWEATEPMRNCGDCGKLTAYTFTPDHLGGNLVCPNCHTEV